MIKCYTFDLGRYFMFTDGEWEESKRRKMTCGIQEGTLLHSLSYWVSVYGISSCNLAIRKGEFLKFVL
jgi:hypothetical protein